MARWRRLVVSVQSLQVALRALRMASRVCLCMRWWKYQCMLLVSAVTCSAARAVYLPAVVVTVGHCALIVRAAAAASPARHA